MSQIRAILFDADGVLQRPAIAFRAELGALLALPGAEIDDYVADIFETERPALVGERDFVDDLQALLERRGHADRLQKVLELFTAIEVDPAMQAAVLELRSRGFVCGLATNQTAYRGGYMHTDLGYAELFDHGFYSYRLGHAKPDPQYFRALATELALPPERILFIDDHEPNVLSAREVGLNGSVFTADPTNSGETLRALLRAMGVELA